jgi:hypothetical protein
MEPKIKALIFSGVFLGILFFAIKYLIKNNKKRAREATNRPNGGTESNIQLSPQELIDKQIGITRTRLNVQAGIGLFIFGWLMKMNYDDLGEKTYGRVFLISCIFFLVIGKQTNSPFAFVIAALIYIIAWIHTNLILTNLQNQIKENYSKKSSQESSQ